MRKFSSYGPIIASRHYHVSRQKSVDQACLQLVGEPFEEGEVLRLLLLLFGTRRRDIFLRSRDRRDSGDRREGFLLDRDGDRGPRSGMRHFGFGQNGESRLKGR